jgi:hypothetical protein
MAKKRKYASKDFEAVGASFKGIHGATMTDTSASIFESMLQSEAFKSLKHRQQILYVYCKAQYYGKRKPRADYKDIPELQGDDLVYFNFDVAVEYGRYTKKSSKLFYTDMDALIKAGFIERIVSGKAHKKKTIYKYSARWKGS